MVTAMNFDISIITILLKNSYNFDIGLLTMFKDLSQISIYSDFDIGYPASLYNGTNISGSTKFRIDVVVFELQDRASRCSSGLLCW